MHHKDLFNDELNINDKLDDLVFLLPLLWNEMLSASLAGKDFHNREPNKVDSNLSSDQLAMCIEGECNESMTEHAPCYSSPNLPDDKSGLMMEPTPSDGVCISPTPGIWIGVTCHCHSHPCNTFLPLSSPLHINNICKIIAHFNLLFHLFQRYMICNNKNGFIPLECLSSHLFSYNSLKKLNAGWENNKQFGNVIDHISSAF